MRLLIVAYMSLMRFFANHCIIPPLRILLFRLSGIKIGRKVFINMDVKFIDDWRRHQIVLEDEVAIASFASLVAKSDPNNSFIGREYDVIRNTKVVIRRGAWLGVGSVILHSTVGKGAIVGSNAVVTRDIDDFAIVAGIPARKIGDVRDKRRR